MALTLYFIDAYNLMHRDAGLGELLAKDPAAARTQLYRWLLHSDRLGVDDLRVVIDGARLPAEEPPTGLAVSWTRSPETADERILKLLLREARRARSHRPLVVVSDDRDLREQAKYRGAQLMACAAFQRDFLTEEAPQRGTPASGGPDKAGIDSEEDRLARERGDSLRVRKGGAGMSEQEAEQWLELFGEDEATPAGRTAREEEVAAEDWQGAPPEQDRPAPPREERPAGEPDPGRAPKKLRRTRPLTPEEEEYARLLGVDPDDPGLYEDGEEDPLQEP